MTAFAWKKLPKPRSLLLFFVGSVTAVLVLPRLLNVGMFTDGIVYAAISQNLADGRGSPWRLFFTPSMYQTFNEHPPLAFWLQALYFVGFGDAAWVESVFSLTMAGFMVASMLAVWKALSLPKAVGFWWPWLFLLSMPLLLWAVDNNLLENTVAIFTTLAVATSLWGMRFAQRWRRFLWGCVAGAFVVGGVLTKGPVALFPLAVFALAPWLVPGVTLRACLMVAAGLGTALALTATALFAAPESRDSAEGSGSCAGSFCWILKRSAVSSA